MTRLNDCYSSVFSYVLYLLDASGAGVGYDKAREDILGLLEDADDMAAAGKYPQQDVLDAKFAVCAWVDETILRSGWEGAKRWGTNQLQQFFFKTHNAGVEFFERMEALRSLDSPARETYALCLGLGFQGKFYVEGREEELSGVRLKTIREAVGKTQPDFSEESRLLFPEAYQALAPKGGRFNPWAFDWWVFLIPVLSAVIAAELYFYLRNDLNIQLLGFFGSLS